MRHPRAFLGLSFGVLLVLGVSSCATLQQIAALRNVEFSLDRVSDLRLAGIDLGRIHSFEDLGILDAGRMALAVSQKRLPLDFRLHLSAENPATNTISARLVQMDWTLLLQDRETLSGVFDGDVLLPPGQPTDVPLTISLNLVDFFEGSAQDLLELALSLAGQGGAPKEVALRATPVIDTPLGPMRYPRPITILSREFGRSPNLHLCSVIPSRLVQRLDDLHVQGSLASRVAKGAVIQRTVGEVLHHETVLVGPF